MTLTRLRKRHSYTNIVEERCAFFVLSNSGQLASMHASVLVQKRNTVSYTYHSVTHCVVILSSFPDWRIHCATNYHRDGFWMYITQIASCSPWMFWMFLNSVFHLMWVAVLIMCQLYQVSGARPSALPPAVHPQAFTLSLRYCGDAYGD